MIQQHGGNISRLENILDFSANINPLGVPESVRAAIAGSIESVEVYPDPYCTELRETIAVHERISAENIVCGNGADDLIFRIAHAFRPVRAVVCAPTFSEYSRALAEVNCEVTEHRMTEENGFALTDSLLEKLSDPVDMCIVCTPNNPTGRLIPPSIMERIAWKCQENGIVLVCDECFLGFVCGGEEHSLRSCFCGSSIILKAFTKLYAMPGIRLGYAVCSSKEIAVRLQSSGQFWSVSGLAQRAGIAALGEKEYLRKTQEHIAEERSFLAGELSALGVRVFDAAANFLFFRGRAGLCEEMLREGILIRDCQDYSGLSAGFYRIAVRTRDENIRLIAALRRCING